LSFGVERLIGLSKSAAEDGGGRLTPGDVAAMGAELVEARR